jgi:DNA-binding NarL/FixJ family response regulator
MLGKTRVLIIEDDPNLRRQYQEILKRLPDVNIDVASDRAEAFQRVDTKTYHLALIDIMLNGPDDLNDRGGIDVMKRIRELDEGTEMIVLSGAKNVEVPVETLIKYKAWSYIIKHHVKSRDDILGPVQDCLEASSGLKVYGDANSIMDYLAIGQGQMMWSDKAQRILNPTDGWAGLNAFVSVFFGALAPLLPRHGSTTLTDLDDVSGLLKANLWSKAIGSEVVIFARHGFAKEPPPIPQKTAKLILHYEKVLIEAWAYAMQDSKRSEFIDSLHDEHIVRLHAQAKGVRRNRIEL